MKSAKRLYDLKFSHTGNFTKVIFSAKYYDPIEKLGQPAPDKKHES